MAGKKLTKAQRDAEAKKNARQESARQKFMDEFAVSLRNEDGLSPSEERFVQEYLIDMKPKQAAIRAGYGERSAQQMAFRLLSREPIRVAIVKAMRDREMRTRVSQDRTLLELARIGFNDPRKAFDGEGQLRPISQWDDAVAASVSSVKIHELKGPDGDIIGHTKELKFWDKTKAIDSICRHLGLYNDKLTIKSDIAGELSKRRQRVKDKRES